MTLPLLVGITALLLLGAGPGAASAAGPTCFDHLAGIIGTTLGLIQADRARREEAEQRRIAEENEASAKTAEAKAVAPMTTRNGTWTKLARGIQWALLGIGTIGAAIDRCAFQMSLVVSVLGWLYIASRRVSPTLHSGYQLQLKRCLLLSAAAPASNVRG